jgi:hypothetical protein
MLAALDAVAAIDVRWRGGALDRLLDEAHASLMSTVAGLLSAAGWLVQIEVTYSEFGERGSIDILAFFPAARILLVIEIKTELAAVDSTLRKLDEKVRLARKVARERFGWDARSVGWLLVMPESSTARRRVERHADLFRRTFPVRGTEIRRWVRNPHGPIAGLWFLSDTNPTSRMRRHGGSQRVRTPKVSADSNPTAG